MEVKKGYKVWELLKYKPQTIEIVSFAIGCGLDVDLIYPTGIHSPSEERKKVAEFFRAFADGIEKGE